eukprot:TRINITY_DN376_c0_g1_i3.p1 TRINITY_DN376_c0_g1~~TRINITY_DN376_c0_g1_i3.p1  ORF type:complete len:300 (+),score=32.04 TRINITY_DN376_c0_g1_i3:418-1317(+)
MGNGSSHSRKGGKGNKPGAPIRAAVTQTQGPRPKQEDRWVMLNPFAKDPNTSYFAVFDGHGGARTSEFARRHFHEILREDLNYDSDLAQALTRSLGELDRRIVARGQAGEFRDGSTAAIATIRGARLTVANVGDSRVVLCRRGLAVAMSVDHTPRRRDEAARVAEAGGVIRFGRVNVDGCDTALAVTRALGDYNYKQVPGRALDQQPVVATPEIKEEMLGPHDEFLIVASDGVWCVMSNQEAVDYVRDKMRTSTNPAEASDYLVKKASQLRRSPDNVTVIIVTLNFGRLNPQARRSSES